MSVHRRSARWAPAAALTAAAWLAGPSATAQQAVVHAYGDPSREIGQAFLAHWGPQCVAILPTHVAEEASFPQAFRREGSEGLLGEALSVRDLGDDLSVAILGGAITNDCGYSLGSISRAVGERLAREGLATVRSVGGDGTVRRTSVAIIDDDLERFVHVKPTDVDEGLTKGQSGSLLMSGDQPLGLLLSVKGDYGRILRLDVTLGAVEASLAGSPSTPAKDFLRADARSAAAGDVVGWNVMPIDAEHRPQNLFVAGTLPWIADVAAWPAEIELDLPGEKLAITGVVLDAAGVEDTGWLPGHVEVFFSVSREERRWRSLIGGEPTFEGGRAHIGFAPVFARHLRLVIASARDGGGRVALGRIHLIAP